MGAEEARIKVRPLVEISKDETDPVKVAESVLKSLLAKMGITASVEFEAETTGESEGKSPPTIGFNIRGDDLGILIGRRGQTLACLQFIIRQIVAHKTKSWVLVNIDVEEYKKRHHLALKAMAMRIAEQVKAKNAPFTLRPMTAFDRRLVHLALANDPAITTESTGEGQARRVVISPTRA